MNNYERIKKFTIEEMAEDRIQSFQGYAGSRIEYYGDFEGSKNSYNEALENEILWLKINN
jgi:hypothetical protein